MGSYDDLHGIVSQIVDAAIDSDMARYGFGPDGSGGYVRYWGDAFGGSGEDRVPGPGQGGTPDMLTSRSGGTSETFNAATDVYGRWQQQIPALFDEWFQIPEPTTYQSHLTWIESSVRRLALDGASVEAPPDAQGNDALPVGYYPPNTGLNGLEDSTDYAALYDGDAMRTFHSYLGLCQDSVRFQFHVSRLLFACLRAEQEVWWRTQDDVAELATQAVYAMQHARPGGDFDAVAALKVVFAVGSVAALFFTGGAASVALKAANTTIGLARLVTPGESKETEDYPLKGFVPDQVHDHLKAGLDHLKTLVRAEETKIETALTEEMRIIDGHLSAFDPGDPEIDDATSADDFAKDRVHVSPEQLRWMGRDLLPPSAEELELAGSGADPYGKGSVWHRPAGIGLGATGPWEAYAALSDRLHDQLVLTARKLQDSADAAVLVADDFDRREDAIDADLRRHRDQVASVPYETNEVLPAG